MYPLAKVKCAQYESTVMAKARKTQIAPGVQLSIQGDVELPGHSFQSVLEVLLAIQILTHAWALTGTETVTSTEDPKLTGLDGDYNEGMAYYGFALDKGMTHPGPPSETVTWLVDRDRQTRTKARTLVSEGCPWGKALRLAWEVHLSVIWTCGGVGVSQAVPRPILDRASNAAASSILEEELAEESRLMPLDKHQCCPDFNGPQGCTKQKFCPHNLWHACTYVENGVTCGSMYHGKSEHLKMAKKQRVTANMNAGPRLPRGAAGGSRSQSSGGRGGKGGKGGKRGDKGIRSSAGPPFKKQRY